MYIYIINCYLVVNITLKFSYVLYFKYIENNEYAKLYEIGCYINYIILYNLVK